MKKIFISGKLLNEFRVKAGLTQEELAKELGITRVTLTGWEGKNSVKIDEKQAKTIQTLLRVTINVLTNVPHGTKTDTELDLYKQLANERMERIEELKQQVQSLKKELAECRSGK